MSGDSTPVTRAGKDSLRWLYPAALVVVLDQASKWYIVLNFAEFDRLYVLPVFDIVRYHNTGAAFSLLADAGGWQQWVFMLIALVVSAGILWYQWSLPKTGCRTLAAGLTFILGGAVGNVIDRLTHGYVVDFLLFHYKEWSWPAFNLADSAITVGVALVIIDSVFFERKRIRTE
jgi:signal peptidase II